MKKQKLLALLLCLVFVISTAVGCAKNNNNDNGNNSSQEENNVSDNNGENEEKKDSKQENNDKQENKDNENEATEPEDYGLIRIAVSQGGTQYETPEDNDLVEKEIQKMLLEDRNALVDLEVIYLTQSQKEQEVNLKVAAGERIDIIGQHWSTTPGFMQPLTKYIDEFGPNIKAIVSDDAWKNSTIDGEIVAIPQERAPWAIASGWSVRRELLDEAGIDKKPETIEETEYMFEKFKEMGYIPLASWSTEKMIMAFGGTFDGFKGSWDANYPVYIDEKGNVMPEILTTANLDVVTKLREWVEKEFIPADYVTMNAETAAALIKTGKVASWVEGNIGWSGQFIEPLMAIEPDVTVEIIPWMGKMPKLLPAGAPASCPPTAENIEGVIKYLDWICEDFENFYTAAYGLNGVHGDFDFENLTESRYDKTSDGRDNNFGGRALVAVMNFSINFGKRMQTILPDDATELQKKTKHHYDELFDSYLARPDSAKVKNDYYNLRVILDDDSIRADMEDEYKIVRQKRDAYVMEGKYNDYIKALDEFKASWESKYMKYYTDAYNKALSN